MGSYPKYKRLEPIPVSNRRWPDKQIKKAPTWCSVDLRDGNQALPIPMSPTTKLEYFKLLLKIGFKEIEIGFPSASQDDFDFCRKLIEDKLIPDDVTISVLVQARKHLIERTVEALKGAHKAVIHCYVASSDLHGRFVFNNDRDAVLQMAVEGTKLIIDEITKNNMQNYIGYEFSPEEFTDTDPDFAIELCKKVKETWGKCQKGDFILNLPATVERRTPNEYADMIEYFIAHYPYMDETVISIHAHNDQGCAVAASQMAMLAGAERVEGTLFGHGERTGNVDIVTLALNLQSCGVDSKLDFSNIDEVVETVEKASNIYVHPRHPYAGSLVYTAFSGSHQDAIRKGIDLKEKSGEFFKQNWKVPYLHIDPADVGRKYEKLIRINSQSGKGGIVYVLEQDFGYYPPKKMHPEIGRTIQKVAETQGNELTVDDILAAFEKNFVEVQGRFEVISFARINSKDDKIKVAISLKHDGKEYNIEGTGNGPISAMVHALKTNSLIDDFKLEDFSEQTLGTDADAVAMAYIGLSLDDKLYYGAGKDANIDKAAMKALFSALNLLSQ